MQNYLFVIGASPKVNSKELKKAYLEGERQLLKGTPFTNISGYPPYSTVARNIRQSGTYSAVVYMDGAYSQTISFHLITCIDDEK